MAGSVAAGGMMICCLVLWGSISLVVPAVNLGYAVHEASNLTCQAPLVPNIPMWVWMMVYGAVNVGVTGLMLFGMIMMGASVCCQSQLCMLGGTCFTFLGAILNWLALFFNLAWLVVGSIIFWSPDGCLNNALQPVPTQVRGLMWATLIIGFVFALLSFFVNRRRERSSGSEA